MLTQSSKFKRLAQSAFNKQLMRNFKLFSAFSLLLLFVQCKGGQKINTAENKSSSEPSIIFLNYTVSKNTEGLMAFELTNKIVVEGKLKQTLQPSSTQTPGSLKFIQLGDDLNQLLTVDIQNPLNRVVEYVNGNGQLEQKQIELEEAELSFRMQLLPDTKSIIIQQLGASEKEHITLSTIQL